MGIDQQGKSYSVSNACAAILDRLLHHADIVVINGERFQIRRKDVKETSRTDN